MDTLISVGVAAEYLWSLYALAFGTAGRAGMQMSFAWLAQGSGAAMAFNSVFVVSNSLRLRRFQPGGQVM